MLVCACEAVLEVNQMGVAVWSVVRSHFLTGLDIVGVRKYYRLFSDMFGSVMGLMASEIF